MACAAHAHSLLHVNLNSRDAAASAAFYERALGLTVGMRTSGEPASGTSLGVDGDVTTLACFLYDGRGPRAAPAVEVLEWRDPPYIGVVPADPHHAGLAALGFAVPSLAAAQQTLLAIPGGHAAALGHWPTRGAERALLRTRDADGAAVELCEDTALPSPQLAYVRVNVRHLGASLDWYGHLGLVATHEPIHREVHSGQLDENVPAAVTIASIAAAGDLRVSFELTAWQHPAVTGSPIAPAYHVGLYRIALGVDDVHAAWEELREGWPHVAAPVWVELPGTKLGGVHVLFLTDPDGVIVELVQRPQSAMSVRPAGPVTL